MLQQVWLLSMFHTYQYQKIKRDYKHSLLICLFIYLFIYSCFALFQNIYTGAEAYPGFFSGVKAAEA